MRQILRSRFARVLCPVALSAIWGLSACSPLGPHNMRRDRLTYDREVARGDKQEMLMNIVRLRFAEMPTMLRTTQIIAGYSYQRQASGNISGSPWSTIGGLNVLGGSASVSLSDNPTLTYQPLVGKDFADSIMAPIPPGVLVPLLQGDAPIDILLTLMVQTIGRADNVRLAGTTPELDAYETKIAAKLQRLGRDEALEKEVRVERRANKGEKTEKGEKKSEDKIADKAKNDPLTPSGVTESRSRVKDTNKNASMEFAVVVHLMRRLQLEDAIHIRTFSSSRGNKHNSAIAQRTFLIFETPRDDRIAELQDMLIRALDLPPRTQKAEILYGEEKTRPDQVPMVTRSLLNVMTSVSGTVEVEPSLIKEGYTFPTVTEPVAGTRVPVLIHSGLKAPSDSYASIEYGGYYYWVDSNDYASKEAFVLLEMMNSLATTAATQGAIVTIPTGS